jgi:hypothetical protein
MAPINITTIKDIATIAGVGVGVVALIKSFWEYRKQGAQKRAEHFLAMRQRLKGNESFKRICNLLDTNDEQLRKIPFEEKRDFLGLFEEVAIAMNSRLIKPEVAHYMFGFYAIKCWESGNFWEGNEVNKESIYWVVFKDFAISMKNIETSFRFKRKNFSF